MASSPTDPQEARDVPRPVRRPPVAGSRRPVAEKEPPRSFWTIILALLVGGLIFIVLFFLTLGYAGLVAAVVAALFMFTWFHWLVWGRWLTRVMKKEIDAEAAAQAAEAAKQQRERTRLED